MKIFLIAPYSIDRNFEEKRSIINDVFLKFGFELLLAEDNNKGSLSAETTIRLFEQADYFIADVSCERPSCYYELGYLQAQKKDISIIAKKNEKIHQLLYKDSIEYFNDLGEYKKIIEKIVRKLTKAHKT
jgi:nucleoside 2-deoxyribosyltransferase